MTLVKKISTKLHSKRGASIIYSIMLFLVATFVTVLILSSSLTALKRMQTNRESEQANMILNSAAGIINAYFEEEGLSFIRTTTETLNKEGAVTGEKVTYALLPEEPKTVPAGEKDLLICMHDQLLNAVKTADEGLAPYQSSANEKITMELADIKGLNYPMTEIAKSKKITILYDIIENKMSEDTGISVSDEEEAQSMELIFTLLLEDEEKEGASPSDSKGGHKYYTYLVIPVDGIKVQESKGINKRVTTKTLVWKEGTITPIRPTELKTRS